MHKKDTIQFIITGVLVIIFIGIIVGNFGGKKPPKVVPIARKDSSPHPETIGKDVPKTNGKYAKLEEESKHLEVKRDPFTRQPKLASGPYLSGIAWDEEYPTAIINDTIVKIGDEIAGHKVIDIQKDKVILHDGNRPIELKTQTE